MSSSRAWAPLWRGLAFCGLGAALIAALSAVYLGVVIERSRLGRVDALLGAQLDEVEVLALGDSHSLNGFDPTRFAARRAFNFSTGGESYLQTYYKLKALLALNPARLRAVVLPFDLHSFSAYRAGRFEYPGYWARYVDFADLGRQTGDPLGALRHQLHAVAVPFLGDVEAFWGAFRNALKDQIGPTIVAGHYPRAEDFSRRPDRAQRAQARARSHLMGHDPFDPVLAAYFERIVALCRQRALTLVLVRYPVTRAYHAQAARLVDEAALDARAAALLADAGEVFVLDHRARWFDREELFADPDHLNRHGAQQLSDALREQFDALGVALPQGGAR